ncbi:heavy metal translocating P-type ATPase, partial [Acidobacteria bacterium ACD]|nr:heavy metal translocating P-type ATPase [Acidobacteria bacterium ACD]
MGAPDRRQARGAPLRPRRPRRRPAGRPTRGGLGEVTPPRDGRRLSAAPVACAHCGLAVPPGLLREGETDQFCCAGCRQVYRLVKEWGLDQYYRLVDQQQGVLEPAKVTGRSFEDFDDLALQAEATEAAGAGRCRTRLYLEGVHCAACVWLVEKLPAVLPGVEEVRLNLGSAVAEVTWRPGATRLSAVARALDRLGYTPHVHRAGRVQEARRAEDRTALARLGVAAACAMNLMFLHGALYAGEYQPSPSPSPPRSPRAPATSSAGAARSGSTRSRCSSRRSSAPGSCSGARSARRSNGPTRSAGSRSSSSRGASRGRAPAPRPSRSRSPRSPPASA